VVFFIGCKLKWFFDSELASLKVSADEFVRLFWFEGDIDASCFDHEDSCSLFFEVVGNVSGEDVCLVSLGDVLVNKVNWWYKAVVSFWVVGVSKDRDDVGSCFADVELFAHGDR
jgi:hypothetical protein